MAEENPFEIIHVEQLKDHELRDLINDLTHVARKYANTQQLREQLAHAVQRKLRPYRNKVMNLVDDVASDREYLETNDPLLKCTVLCKNISI